MLLGPFHYSTATAAGVTATNPITVPAMLATSVVLGVWGYKMGAAPIGFNVADATPAAGTLTFANDDTSTYSLVIVFA